MKIGSASDLIQLKTEREGHYAQAHAVMNELIQVRQGNVPGRFETYFPAGIPIQIINMIRMAHQDHTAMAGKVFPVYVPPRNATQKAKREAEKVEQILYGYNDASRRIGGMNMELLMKTLAWWLTLCGDAVLMVLPHAEHKTPFFTFRDPRTHLPPLGWAPWSQAPLDGTMFAQQMRLGELKMRWPKHAAELSSKHARSIVDAYGKKITTDENPEIWVGEYYSKDCWMVATLEDNGVTLSRSDTGDRGHPDVCPVVPMTMYSPDGSKGRPLYADQVPLQMVLARIISQQVDFVDKTIYPEIYGTPLVDGQRKYGPGSYNEFDVAIPGGERPMLEVVSPQGSNHSDQLMSFIMGASRMLNHDPEVFQGIGEANSAKALDVLKSGIHMMIEDTIWPMMTDAMPKAYTVAMEMDMNLWGAERKVASGVRKNSRYAVDYTPMVALKGYTTSVVVEPGLGLAGVQGKLEIMQMLDAGIISRSTALEMIPNFPEPEKEGRSIDADMVRELILADLGQRAANNLLPPGALAEIQRLIEEEELTLSEAVQKVQNSGGLEAPMDPMAALAGGGPGGGGGMPDLAAMMGGGPAPAPPMMPSLGELQGTA